MGIYYSEIKIIALALRQGWIFPAAGLMNNKQKEACQIKISSSYSLFGRHNGGSFTYTYIFVVICRHKTEICYNFSV